MLKTFFKTGFRSLKRNFSFSLINVSGLAIGLSAALVIYLIVQHELSFDKFHKDGDRIYRVVSKMEFPDLTIHNSGVPVPTAAATVKEVTGIETGSLFMTTYETKVAVPQPGSASPAVFKKQKDIIYADNQYFALFDYKWLAGSPLSALKDPFQVVISEGRAKTYFGNLSYSDIPGRKITYNDSITVTVSGVVESFKENSDFRFEEFISMETVTSTGLKEHYGMEEWGNINSSTQFWVKLMPGVSTKQVTTQLTALREKYRTKDKEKPDAKDDITHALQALSNFHFSPDYDNFGGKIAHMPTLYGLQAVAIFLLLLGCINFINLTTAQASKRAKEIGIRKTMGSSKMQLIMQFMGETFLLTFFATILSLAISPWLINIFKDFIPAGVGVSSLNQLHVWIFLLILIVVVTIIAGLYPSIFLTKFEPVAVLKNQYIATTGSSTKAWLRKTLTITQFIIAQFLLIATLVVSKQIHYSMNKDLGFKKDAILYLNTRWNFFSDKVDNSRFALLDKLKAIPGIEMVSLAGSPPSSNNTSSTTMKFKDGDQLKETMVEVKNADKNYFDVYGMKLIAGSQLMDSDTSKEFIINETFARFMGYKNPADAVGKSIESGFNKPIKGVVADFHTKSTQQLIKPLAFSAASKNSYTIHLKLAPKGGDVDKWKNTLAAVEKEYKQIYPDDDFTANFFDESIAKFYQEEQNISRLLKWASGLCIFISCLGLLGLVMYTTSQRTKEIGVRKVLGASVTQIVALLSKDLLALVILAFVIAAPVAWYFMNKWLLDYSYRTSFSWWIFAVTILGMLLIALITLSIRTIRSANANPVKALRSE
jgi:putative ABC transport system permease protein